jgi:hypothetical protein
MSRCIPRVLLFFYWRGLSPVGTTHERWGFSFFFVGGSVSPIKIYVGNDTRERWGMCVGQVIGFEAWGYTMKQMDMLDTIDQTDRLVWWRGSLWDHIGSKRYSYWLFCLSVTTRCIPHVLLLFFIDMAYLRLERHTRDGGFSFFHAR